MAPEIIFGTATFGMDKTNSRDSLAVKTLLKTLQKAGIHRLDSAARYPPMKPGRSEELIGESKEVSSKFQIDTKVSTRTDPVGELTRAAVTESVNASLYRLKELGVTFAIS